MRIPNRFLLIPGLVLLAALLFAAAAQIGRGSHYPLVVAEMSGAQTDEVSYWLVDVGRGLSARRDIAAPYFAEAHFAEEPARIMQTAPAGSDDPWTMSTLDAMRGTLEPQLVFASSSINTALPYMLKFIRHASGRWQVNASGGAVYYGIGAQGEQQMLPVGLNGFMEPSGEWSPDGARLAVIDESGLHILDADSGETLVSVANDFGRVRWSADGRYVLTTMPSSLSAWPVTVIDARSGEKIAEVLSRSASWCGSDLLYAAETDGVFEVRLRQPVGGAERVLFSRDLSDIEPMRQAFNVMPPPGRMVCDWLWTSIVGEPHSLYHIESGTRVPLAINVQVLSITVESDVFSILVHSNSRTELRRVVLDPPMLASELVTSVPSLSTTLKWLDDTLGGVTLVRDALVRVDASGVLMPLGVAPVRAFYVLR